MLIPNTIERQVIKMNDKIHTKNSFKTADIERLKKTVTEKIEKLVNRQVKRTN